MNTPNFTIDLTREICSRDEISLPTRQCLVCERKENPKAEIVDTYASWLCDKCRAALLKVVESEDTE